MTALHAAKIVSSGVQAVKVAMIVDANAVTELVNSRQVMIATSPLREHLIAGFLVC